MQNKITKNKQLLQITDKIKTHFNPRKIIVFGSYAWGKPTEDSDIDIFLIMESNLRRDERARQVQKIFSQRTFPLDVIVYTPEEVEQSLKRGNPFIKEILNQGVLYE
jgi:predicted nucleotidyltransferase